MTETESLIYGIYISFQIIIVFRNSLFSFHTNTQILVSHVKKALLRLQGFMPKYLMPLKEKESINFRHLKFCTCIAHMLQKRGIKSLRQATN